MTGIIKGLDPQRRLVIPKDTLLAAGFKEGDLLEVWADVTPDGVPCVILTKYLPGCVICGSKENLLTVKAKSIRKKICSECLELLVETAKEDDTE